MRPVRTARVVRINDHASDTRSLFFEIDGAPLGFTPGQFISIQIPLMDEVRTRAYTLASSPGEPVLEIVFNRVAGGRGVEWLFERAIGDEISFVGPFGTFTLEKAPAVETVFVAEGTAIAPIRPMLRRASTTPGHPRLTLIFAARTELHLIYRDEFAALAQRDPQFGFETMLAPADQLYARLRTEIARRFVAESDDRSRVFYLCGVGKPVVELRDLLRGADYERRAVHYEQW